MADAAVCVENVTLGYGERIILQNVSFEIRSGEIVALLGGSGCGKSTMLKAIIGLRPVRSGDIRIDGESIVRATGEAKRRIMRRFGVAFQGGALFRSYTIRENIALPLEEYTDYSREEINRLVSEKLEMVDMKGTEDMMPGDLSGGMIKRAAVARALALNPKILFLDEPSAGLDPLNSANLDDVIKSIRDRSGAAVGIVTHELDSIFSIADRAVFLDRDTKTVIANGPPAALRESCPIDKVRLFLNRGRLNTGEKK